MEPPENPGRFKTRIRLHLTPLFRGKRRAALTTAHVRTYTTARIDAGAAPASVNRDLAILKRAFSPALQSGSLMVRPHIPMLREHNVRTGFFDRALFDAVASRLRDPLGAVVGFAYLTGWRIPSEVLTLEWR
jgi:hypothetical protein